MKKIIFLVTILFLLSCDNSLELRVKDLEKRVIEKDSIISSLNSEISLCQDYLIEGRGKLEGEIDSLLSLRKKVVYVQKDPVRIRVIPDDSVSLILKKLIRQE